MNNVWNKNKKLAGINYAGSETTRSCIDAIIRRISYGDEIRKAILVSCENRHAFILTLNNNEEILAIKSGFTSGYNGEGPKGLSYTIRLLWNHVDWLDEYSVDNDFIERINNSSLTNYDLWWLDSALTTEPGSIDNYILESDDFSKGALYSRFPTQIPLSITDYRILEFANEFYDNPDNALLHAYRRLEDIVRRKSGLGNEHSSKLFVKAFQDPESPLTWQHLNQSESQGRINLFTGAYMAFRNRRAHKEPEYNPKQNFNEFMLLNLLFTFESEAVVRQTENTSA